MNPMTPIEVAQASFLMTLIYATVAVVMYAVVTFGLLRLADKISGLHFKNSFYSIQQQGMAYAIYLSVRYAVLGLGSAWIISSIFQYA